MHFRNQQILCETKEKLEEEEEKRTVERTRRTHQLYLLLGRQIARVAGGLAEVPFGALLAWWPFARRTAAIIGDP